MTIRSLHERIWDKLYWTMMPRGQTGYAAHALAAIDVALWGIKGKALESAGVAAARRRPRPRAGLRHLRFRFLRSRPACRSGQAMGRPRLQALKMTVGDGALRNRDKRPVMEVIREDAARVQAVREAVGPDIEIYIDGNCNLDLYHATKLVEMIKPLGISFFEEPLTQNDAQQMAQLRRATGIALACGQNEGLAFRFRDLLLHEAMDFVQPNVCITGGFTQCLRIAGLASSFNVSVANGGAWGYHNMHLQAGVANGTLVEHHYLAVELYKQIYRDLPMPADGYFTMPDAPGLGFEPNRDAIREIAKLPLSKGTGKG